LSEYDESFVIYTMQVDINFWSFVFTRYSSYKFKVWWNLLQKFHSVYNGEKYSQTG